MNIYAYSKHIFDIWAMKKKVFNKIAGIKFFNVFGPNEYHKDDMLSVVYKAFQQILKSGRVKLFKSAKEDFKNGEQKRDFVYIKDVVKIIEFFINSKNTSGIYNVGTGKARTFNDLAKAVFGSLGKEVNIEYIDMPNHLRSQYQYFTEAYIKKLRKAGYKNNLHTFGEGIEDYVQNFLDTDDPYL